MVVSFMKQEKGNRKESLNHVGRKKKKKKKKTSSELYGTGEKSHIKQLRVPYFFVTTIFVSKSFQIGKVKAEHY